MDKDEVITLSSDDEYEFTEKLKIHPALTIDLSCLEKLRNIEVKNNLSIHSSKNVEIAKLSKVPKKKPKLSNQESPEVVDLEDCSEKFDKEEQVQVHHVSNELVNTLQNHTQEVIDIDEVANDSQHNSEEIVPVNHNTNSQTNNPSVTTEKHHQDTVNDSQKETEILENQNEALKPTFSEGSDQNLKFFTEFVEYCGSLEEIPSDRIKLTKKLMKRYGEANCQYVKSQKFRDLIEKCKVKVHKNNLYLVAKEITDELIYRKKFENDTGKTNVSAEKSQSEPTTAENSEIVVNSDRKTKKRTRLINKIVKKLDKLGSKIRELEEKEVDLSDEEESSYVQLQRYRERFCQIYTKLCKYTNDVVDADRIYTRKICFTESKYPAINRCIENWLNKTKRFPDFMDIMKLLESQSSSLGLPSNKDSIRVIATEIFQQVGVMLQRRRKYDLWDSFCGFLDQGEDPAQKDPLLDEILKSNYEIRVKKENEIFQHYVELQEKDRLEPEEVPDEEANHSPVDSGNEEEKEIEEIENSMNQRLDDEIKEDTKEDNPITNDCDEEHSKQNSVESTPKASKILFKESKNNYKNCKSLKWRLENWKRDSENSDAEGNPESNRNKNESKVSNGNVEVHSKIVPELFDSSKRKRDLEIEGTIPKKKICPMNITDTFESSETKVNEVFEVHRCQVYTENAFEDFDNEKTEDWGKRKVFRDLTNVNRLMELHGRKTKMSGLFSTSFFHRRFCDRHSWKKRFKVNFRLVGSKGQKYALSQEDKSGKTVSSDSGGDSDEKDIQNNSEGGDDDGNDNFFNSRGNGNEEDNNGDENKKNGKPDEEIGENQHEEDEDDDDEEEEDDNKAETETIEHSFPIDKTDENTGTNNSREDYVELTTPKVSIIVEKETGDEETFSSVEIPEKPETPEQGSDSHLEGDLECRVECRVSVEEGEPTCAEEDESCVNDTVVSEDEKSKSEVETEDQIAESRKIKDSGSDSDESEAEAAEKGVFEEDKETNNPEVVLKNGCLRENDGTTDVVAEDGFVEVKGKQNSEEETNECTTEEFEETSGSKECKNEAIEKDACAAAEETNTYSRQSEEMKERTNGSAEMSVELSEKGVLVEDEEIHHLEEELDCITEKIKERTADSGETKGEVAEKDVPVEDQETYICGTENDEIKETTNSSDEPSENDVCKEDKAKQISEVEINDCATESRKMKEGTPEETRDEFPEVEVSIETIEVEKPEPTTDSHIITFEKPKTLATEPYPRKIRHLANKTKPNPRLKEDSNGKPERKRPAFETQPTRFRNPFLADQKSVRKSTPSTSDDEIVKRFLLHSPSSISITPPKKLTLSKPPSQAAIQALATLRNLKGISATIVKGGSKPKSEDDVVVIGGSYRRPAEQKIGSHPTKKKRTDLPVISNVQSIDATTPKIVTVRGNVSGFDNTWPGVSNSSPNSQCNSRIRISNVWGSLPSSFMQSTQNEMTPGCSFQQNSSTRNSKSNGNKKKPGKKTVEYVVLD